MRLFFTTTLCVCCSLVFPWTCLSQDTKPVESVASPVESKGKSVETTVTTMQTQQFVLRVRTAEKVDFAGTVTAVDRESAIISIRNQSKTISFDMSKSILIGYRDVAEIRQGDRVSVGYTKYGLQIRKGSFAVTRQEKPFIPQKTP
ncbi:MAG TPA: hypothetical protein VHO84_14725, partial [Syntrophorhabdaceae bacterium]|nr:hypothetical protein [Syntrophorhabdaceae bacterium]